jgi:hypothetical protein
MAGHWHNTANRGFYYGPSSNNAWNNDTGWKDAVNRETKVATRYFSSHFDIMSLFADIQEFMWTDR